MLDAIIGEGMKSTEGGIGVENLQGSGLIAGETSRAYQELRCYVGCRACVCVCACDRER